MTCDVADGIYSKSDSRANPAGGSAGADSSRLIRGSAIDSFTPAVPPGYRIIREPAKLYYYPVRVTRITRIKVELRDQDGNLIDNQGDILTVKLRIKQV